MRTLLNPDLGMPAFSFCNLFAVWISIPTFIACYVLWMGSSFVKRAPHTMRTTKPKCPRAPQPTRAIGTVSCCNGNERSANEIRFRKVRLQYCNRSLSLDYNIANWPSVPVHLICVWSDTASARVALYSTQNLRVRFKILGARFVGVFFVLISSIDRWYVSFP